MITSRNGAFCLISSMVAVLLDQLQIFTQLYLIEFARTFNRVLHAYLFDKLKFYWIFWIGIRPYFCLFSVVEGFEWFWIVSLCKNIHRELVFLNTSFLVLLFSILCINDLHHDVICNIAINTDDTTLFSNWNQTSDL